MIHKDTITVNRNVVDSKGNILSEEFNLKINVTDYDVDQMLYMLLTQVMPVLGFIISEERKKEILDNI